MLRLLTITTLCLMTLFLNGFSYAQSYPRRAIQLYVPYEVTSNAANQIATLVKKSIQTNSRVELAIVAPNGNDKRSVADIMTSAAASNGYQLMLAHARSHLTAPVLSNSTGITEQPLLGVLASSPMLCVVKSSQRVSALRDAVAMANRDQKFRVSSAGKQSHSYLTALVTLRAVGLTKPFGHIALKSPAAALAALLKGTATFACVPASVAMQLVKSRQIRPLVATSSIPGIDVPTAASLGFSGFEVLDEFAAIAGAKRLRADVSDSWQRWLTRMSKDKAFIEQARQIGFRTGSKQLMLRSQANAALKKRREDLARLLKRYKVDLKLR